MDNAESNRRKMRTIVDDLKEVKEQGDKAKANPVEINLFKGMFISIENMFQRFESLYEENQDHTDPAGNSVATEEDSNLRKSAKSYFHQCNAVWTAINDLPNPEPPSQSNSFMYRSKLRLPNLDLPTFNGDRTKWPRFKDSFTSLILEDPELKDIDRFHFLIKFTKDSAASVIAHVPVTANNFASAWNTMLEHYDNQRLLASAYIDILFNIKQLPQKPSAFELSQTVSKLSETVAAFKQLEIPNTADFMFFHLARRCIDTTTREEFELQTNETFPSFDTLMKYLRSRCTAVELATGLSNITSAGDLNKREKKPYSSSKPPRKSTGAGVSLLAGARTPSKALHSSPGTNKCPVCKAPHLLVNCLKFSTATVAERHNLLKNWRGCKNCLRETTHTALQCTSKWKCRFCHGRHHSLLHNEEHKAAQGAQHLTQDSQQAPNTTPQVSLSSATSDQLSVMLGTAVCHILNGEEQQRLIRLVFDCGSHFSYITRSCARRLGLTVERKTINIVGIGGTPYEGFTGRTQCILSPISSSSYFPISVSAVVLDKITLPLPGFEVPIEIREACASYPLADADFWRTRPIEFVIGNDLFAEMLTGEIIAIPPSRLRLLGTVFGFSVFGSAQDFSEVPSNYVSLHAVHDPAIQSLNQELQRFWDLEEPPTAKISNPSDEYCEELYQSTTYRTQGRYVVRLPFRPSGVQPLNTRGMALRRLEHLENKLSRNSQIRDKYCEFLQEYITLGHMEVASTPGKYVIPHHCVVKGEGTDIKLRVVFDAAARTSTGSLNDLLLVGPKLQSSIVDILLNFRRFKYAFTTDIVKMYRQILVHPEDRPFQHILWRFDSADAVTEYELNTISYGTNCAPYLALRTVRQLIEDEGSSYPLAAKALEDDIYIDDVASGADTLKQALELLHQLIAMLSTAGFSLSKWASNNQEILKACREVDPSTVSMEENVSLESSLDSTNIKILGLQWNPTSDVFSYNIIVPYDTCTKRTVLSSIAKIYDPLGFLGPAVVIAKQLVQEAWLKGLDWDEEFHADMRTKWMQFVLQLPLLRQINIPRWIVPATGPYTILIFADASEKAYCAAAYLCSVTSSNVTQSHLILAKTKLAPVKFTTIPRLELCAALLAARLWQSLQPFCNKLSSEIDVHFFSDSIVVLSWLYTPYYQLKTYVANRVVQIREITAGNPWHHVSSEDNPSDLGSRGVAAGDLINCSIWFHGPKWALSDKGDWKIPSYSPPSKLPELKNVEVSLASTNEVSPAVEWMSKISSFRMMVRCLAYILRLTDRAKKLLLPASKILNVSEVRRATRVAVRVFQSQAFFNNKFPTDDTPMPKNLISLHPFLDESGVVLVGGRLKNTSLPWKTKHPMVIPAKSHLTTTLLQHYHQALLHCGPSLMLASLRCSYWVLSARNAVRNITRNCITCRRFDAPPIQPPMGDLPQDCLQDIRPFLHVGIDFAGPFVIKHSLLRKSTTSKAYLCLMVCLSTKALHLELVSSLSTPAFLAALDRFIGRRGVPVKIYSDNGTNFVGAHNQLKEFYKWYYLNVTKTELCNYATDKEFIWSFNPPHAPSFGGVWEAGVKSVKRLMRTIYGENVLWFEELSTLLIKIEAILNSRPLSPLSNDPNDLEYLSPGHFLIGSRLLATPEPNLLEISDNRLTRWQLVSKKAQHFWQRWRLEYVTSLQVRNKWQHPAHNLQVGDLVLITEENVPRLHWPVGRIHQVFPGKDNIVRVVSVRTTTAILKRPVNKLIPLFLPKPADPPKSPEK